MKTGLAGIFLALLAFSANAQSLRAEDKTALQKAEATYTAGVLHHNTKMLDSVWADTFVDTNEQGGFATKARQLAKVAASKAQIKSLNVDQERVDWYGDTAVVTERFKVTYVLDGKDGSETGRATDVWVKIRGQWKCVAAHSSAIP